jgi:NADH:ubiquinone reductase (H+-translocating)
MTHKIIIVGGGAGGMELATKLGNKLGKRGRAAITLVDRTPTHLWKPLLHQVAAGTMAPDEQELDYLAQARWHHFRFVLGELVGLNRTGKKVLVGPTYDEDGAQITPARELAYDTLVICIGSQSNDFNTPGAREFAIALDTQAEARRFHRRLITSFLRAHSQSQAGERGRMDVVLIGAGATGVELAAELHYSTRQLAAYGMDDIVPDRDIRLTIVEAAPRILPALPERLSKATQHELEKLHIKVLAGERVVRVSQHGVDTQSGKHIPSALTLWAAGIKAPEVLKNLDGLECNPINQLVVTETLQTTRDESIFAFGDCAACPWADRKAFVPPDRKAFVPPDSKAASPQRAMVPPDRKAFVPPRAQAAHQQASLLVQTIARRLNALPALPYRYRDFGSLVSLGAYTTVGNLMGAITSGSIMIEGLFARFMYMSLYKMHQIALHGFGKVALFTVGRLIRRRTEPQIKLH